MKNNKDIQIVRVKLPRKSESYEITIGQDILSDLGQHTRKVLHAQSRRVCLISNQKVFNLYGDIAAQSLSEAGYEVKTFLIGDGERFKSFITLQKVLQFLGEIKLERNDAVVALGGGVVGDLAGFAAAVYLRGVPFIQVPTTLLAQIDSSVGGKTGVNTSFGKNLVGAFHQPQTVLIDTKTLDTLPKRELTAGWCEAIKQGAIGSKKLFDQTVNYLSSNKSESLSRLIAAQCAFKASIVAGDEREDITRTDGRSRRILNFGHTVAHALETITNYKRFRHGEAVGYGMLVAGTIGKELDITPPDALDSLWAAINLAGRLPQTKDLVPTEIIRLIEHDKKSVGGKIKWVFLEQLGKARIVDSSNVKSELVLNSLHAVLRQ